MFEEEKKWRIYGGILVSNVRALGLCMIFFGTWADTRLDTRLLLKFLCQFDLEDSPKKLKTLTKNLWGLQALKNHQRGPSNKGHCRSKPKKSSPQKRRFFGSFSVLIAICGPRRFRIFSVHLRSRPGVRFRREVGIDSGQWVSNYMDPPAP